MHSAVARLRLILRLSRHHCSVMLNYAHMRTDKISRHAATYVLCRLKQLINRAAMGRARFLIYPWFIFFFFLTARPWAERGS